LIRAKIKKMRVWQNVAFQVIHKRWIRYENREIWNMWKPDEVWEHFSQQHERILPLEYSETLDRRPWEPYGKIEFRLKEAKVPDRCKVQPNTPLGQDQVNVILLSFEKSQTPRRMHAELQEETDQGENYQESIQSHQEENKEKHWRI
jgi:hypothetical protein